MRAIGAAVAFILACLVGASGARADDASDCQKTAEPAKSIPACTHIIEGNAVAGHELALVYFNRASAHRQQNEPASAIADLGQAVGLDPQFVAAWNDLGLAYLQSGDADRATEQFDKAIAIAPRFAVAYANRAIADQQKGAAAKALADFDKAIELDPGLGIAYDGRGVSYALAGDFGRAIADYDKAIELDPGNVEALNNRGDAYRSKGDFVRAIADLGRAIALKPDFAEAYYTRGETYKAKGDNALALTDLRQALALDTTGKHRAYGEGLIAEIEPKAAKPVGEPAATAAAPEKRVALVIGNGAYRAVGALPNPGHDADTIGEALRATGFATVTIQHDLDRAGMVAALKAFADAADKADWAVIYYSGHGMEVAGENYLVPIDAKLASDRDVPDEAVSLERVMSAVEGARKLRLVILDACRNNPFLVQMKVTSATRSIGRGLALVEPSQATLVAFAAKAGSLAADGDTANSPFAASFARHVGEPGVEINKVFRLVRSDVLAATDNSQEPFVYGSLPPEDFYFVAPKP